MTQLADNHMATTSWFAELPAGDSASWLDDLRKLGADRFASAGFPSPKSEEWRFTQFRARSSRRISAPARRDGHGHAIADAGRTFHFRR